MKKITLKREKLIRGELEKKGAVVEVNDGVADWLVERGDAELTKAKAEKNSTSD